MIRWGCILIAAELVLGVARADEAGAKSQQAFAAICSAAIDKKADISDIAASVQMEPAGGIKDATITFGRSSIRVFNSPATKQNITITTTSYADAQEIDCRSTVQLPSTRAEFENLAQTMKLDGGVLQVAAVTIGRWKRPGNKPSVFVTMLGTASSSVLTMQRIDFTDSSEEKK